MVNKIQSIFLTILKLMIANFLVIVHWI